MQKKNLQNLKKTDLIDIINVQQEEIDSLKKDVKSLKSKLKKAEKKASINDISLKINKAVEDTEKYLEELKKLQKEATEYLSTIKSVNNSDFEGHAENITNEEELESTNGKETIIIDGIDTKDRSQIVEEGNSSLLPAVFPTNADLAIISSIYINIKRNRLKFIVFYIVSAIVITLSLTTFVKGYSQDVEINSLTQNLENYITENETEKQDEKQYIVDFDELNKINSDTVGWLKVNGIEINMPIVQSNDNSYYLKHSFDNKSNVSGWAFADFRNKFDGTDKNIIIYGHNRRDDIMFSPLVNVLKPDWYNVEENSIITFIDENQGEKKYQVFSVYQTEVEDYYIQTDFSKDSEYQKFFNTLKSRSIKDFNVEVTSNDKILTLSTCGNNSKYRVILHAKQL